MVYSETQQIYRENGEIPCSVVIIRDHWRRETNTLLVIHVIYVINWRESVQARAIPSPTDTDH